LNSREKYEYWLEAAKYDLESARVMMNSGRYPSFKEKISASIDIDRAKNVLNNTEEAFVWIKSLNHFKK